jgi:glutathione S-transferase
VRVVAAEVGEAIDRIDTATEAGMAALREVTPIRKVPVAIVGDGRLLFDSRVIINWLVSTHGPHDFVPPADPFLEANLVNAIDAALDSVIQLFYLRRDGIVIDGTPFAARQLDRTDAIFGWVAPQLRTGAFGLPELSAVCALDWMDFRQTYPTERAGLEPLRAAWRERPTLVATKPHA